MSNLLKVILMISTTFLFSALTIPFVKKVAEHVNALDIPNERKVHKKPMPRLGGLAIYFAFLFGYMLFGQISVQMISVLIGSFIIVLTGMVDDIKPVDAKVKFLFQLLASMVVVFYGQILLKDISAFGIYINFGILAYPITLLFILGCVNCMNFIDGLDGLAGGISSIFFITVGIITFIRGEFGLSFELTFLLLGATLGFLLHCRLNIFLRFLRGRFDLIKHISEQLDE
jgi:UDP-GlcNAc:undecaprenyl-phosphate GlcNAc-1-phosphate transferase